MNFIGTDIKELDEVLGQGLPEGRLVEISGEADSFKSSLIMKLISNVQKQNKVVFYISMDNDISLDFLKFQDINIETLYFLHSNRYEDIYEAIQLFAKHVDLVVLDSLASIYSDNSYKSASDVIKKSSTLAMRHKTCFLIVNQVRSTCDGTSKTQSYCLKAINAYCSIRVYIAKGANIVKDYHTVGYKIRIKTLVNKLFDLKVADVKIFFRRL